MVDLWGLLRTGVCGVALQVLCQSRLRGERPGAVVARVHAAFGVRFLVLRAGRQGVEGLAADGAVVPPGRSVRLPVPVQGLPEGEAAAAVTAVVGALAGVDDPVGDQRGGKLEFLLAVGTVMWSQGVFLWARGQVCPVVSRGGHHCGASRSFLLRFFLACFDDHFSLADKLIREH